MEAEALRNLAAFSAQFALLTAVGGVLPWILRMRVPDIAYTYYRALLLVGLALPLLQQWHPTPAPVTLPVAVISIPSPLLQPVVTTLAAPQPDPVVTPARIALIIAAGIVCRLFWIGLGLVRLRRLRRAGVAAAVPRRLRAAGACSIAWR